jgi:ATP-binding cassette subfamily C protein LapB
VSGAAIPHAGAGGTAPEGGAPTGLDACLLFASTELGRALTPAALGEAEIGIKAEFDIADAVAASENAGLLPWFGAVPLKKLDATLLPAILLVEEGRYVVLIRRPTKKVAAVYDPALSDRVAEMPLDRLAEGYSGYALLLKPEYRAEHVDGSVQSLGHWFWSAMGQNSWTYLQVILAAALTNVIGLASSIFIMVVYDRVLPNEAIDSLYALTAGMAIALAFDFIIKSLRTSFIDRAGHKADRAIGRRIFNKLLDLRLKARQGSTGALSNVLREFESVREFITSATLIALVDLPFLFLYLAVIFMIGGKIATVPIVAVPFVLLIGLAVQPFLARLAESNTSAGQSKQSVLVETVSGLETIKTSGAAKLMRERWDDALTRQSTHGLKSRAITHFAMNATALTQQVAQVLIVFYGVLLIQAGELSMGALVAAVILTGRALAPLAQIAQTLTRLNHVRSAYKSLNTLMKQEGERDLGKSWLSRPVLRGNIDIENLTFAYSEEGSEVLRDCSLSIKAGEKVAIMGRIGSGKSTLARLLLNLYEPTQGAVKIDGADIRQIDPGDLRRNIGACLQDSRLFSGTLRQNIALGAARPRDADILEVARIAGVEEFASRNPEGFDQWVSEGGEGLSGGQRQAVALARALIGKPPILLLDEPTSAMDVQSERQLIARLKPFLQPMTVIVITHRPALLDLVDRVVVLDQGKVVADGGKEIIQQRKTGGGA